MITARRKRTQLFLSIAGLMVMVAAVSAVSARDPSGVSLRVGMVMVTVGAAMWLPWQQLLPAVVLAWLAPNFGRSLIEEYTLFNLNMMLELPFLLGVGGFGALARESLRILEQENLMIGSGNDSLVGINPETGIYDEGQLRPSIEAELARSRRFDREFSLVLVGIDEMRQKYDYRDEAGWKASLAATTRLLQQTRSNVDRVFHFGAANYAMILPESNEKDVAGMVRRLRRVARKAKPPEGESGGPLPVHFGATFFPSCATSVEDLLRRAEVAMRIAEKNTLRYQLDSAEAPELPPGETLRRQDHEQEAAQAVSAYGSPSGAPLSEAPAEEWTPSPLAEEAPSVILEMPVAARESEQPPVLVSVSSPAAKTAPSPSSLDETAKDPSKDTEPLRDLNEILQRMDETLRTIRAVRSKAA